MHFATRVRTWRVACLYSVQCTVQWNCSISETVRNKIHVHIKFIFLRMAGHTWSAGVFMICEGFEVLTAVVRKSTIFRDATSCRPLKFNRSFVGIYRLHLQGRRISRPRNQCERKWQAHIENILLPLDFGLDIRLLFNITYYLFWGPPSQYVP
jgi:hypothetical protein